MSLYSIWSWSPVTGNRIAWSSCSSCSLSKMASHVIWFALVQHEIVSGCCGLCCMRPAPMRLHDEQEPLAFQLQVTITEWCPKLRNDCILYLLDALDIVSTCMFALQSGSMLKYRMCTFVHVLNNICQKVNTIHVACMRPSSSWCILFVQIVESSPYWICAINTCVLEWGFWGYGTGLSQYLSKGEQNSKFFVTFMRCLRV